MKLKRIVTAVAIAVMASSAAFAGTRINQSELPQNARNFIAKYFSKDSVRKVEKDEGRRGTEYEVDFTSGAEAEFMSDGSWKEVKAARGTAVPAGIVPAGIAKYVSENFSGQTIKEIARKRGGYEVELSNGTELHLTEAGAPMQPRQGGQRGNRH